MKKNLLFLLLIFVLFPFSIYAVNNKYVDANTGVQIIWKVDAKMFPENWMDGPINANATSLSPNLINKTLEIIKSALKKYPASIIKKNLKKVYILKDLSFYGVDYGGTYYKNKVYVTNENFAEIDVEKIFHAEFSSILFNNYSSNFSGSDWMAINPSNFRYGEGGANAIKSGKASQNLNEDLLTNGFLTQYGQSEMEEDFNSFTKQIFRCSEGFWEAVDSHEKIKQKLNLVVKFYNSINSVFTEEYFRKISQQ